MLSVHHCSTMRQHLLCQRLVHEGKRQHRLLPPAPPVNCNQTIVSRCDPDGSVGQLLAGKSANALVVTPNCRTSVQS